MVCRCWRILAVAAVFAACEGGPSTDTGRGYTKAPLDEPGVFPKSEPRADVSRFGQTNRPRPDRVTLPDSARPGS
jgi:hypothetical protein